MKEVYQTSEKSKPFRKWWYCYYADKHGVIREMYRTCSVICGTKPCHFKCKTYERETMDELELLHKFNEEEGVTEYE